MNRARKEEVVIDFRNMLSQAESAFIVQYQGIDVASIQKLRKTLREKNASFKVTKARLMKKAFQEIPGMDSFLGDLKTQVALVFAKEETPAVAKALVEFSKEKSELKVVSGFFEEKYVDATKVAFLAALPSREGVMAQIAGTINEIIARIPRALQMANEKRSAESGDATVVAE